MLQRLGGARIRATTSRWSTYTCYNVSLEHVYVLQRLGGARIRATTSRWSTYTCYNVSVEHVYVLQRLGGARIRATTSRWSTYTCYNVSVEHVYVLQRLGGARIRATTHGAAWRLPGRCQFVHPVLLISQGTWITCTDLRIRCTLYTVMRSSTPLANSTPITRYPVSTETFLYCVM